MARKSAFPGRRRWILAGAAAIGILGACGYIVGPCLISIGEDTRTASCDAGGTMVIIPTSVLQFVRDPVQRKGK
jgi:hypothetical protein